MPCVLSEGIIKLTTTHIPKEHGLCAAESLSSAVAHHQAGRLQEAISCYEQALLVDPSLADAYNNLGVALHESGKQEKALASYEKALAINPFFPEAHNNLGIALKALSKPVEAILHHQTAIRLMPGELNYFIGFTECLNNLEITSVNDFLREDMITTCSQDGVNHQALAFAGASIIKHLPGFQTLAQFTERNSQSSLEGLLAEGLARIHSDPLVLSLLKKTILRDRLIERVLTITRRALLDAAIKTAFPRKAKRQMLAFLCALAHQCFVNEYVYAVSVEETGAIEKLRNLITSCDESITGDRKMLMATLACYMPLHELEQDKRFLQLLESTDCEIADLITQQVVHPSEERQARARIMTLGSLDNKISRKVRQQYEQNPYPRWLSVNKLRGESFSRVMRRLFPLLPMEQFGDIEAPEILVAGCGTGQQVVTKSLEFRSARVLGVDISRSSLSYAVRMSEHLQLSNVEFINADILSLDRLNRTFDLIECIGVLHHMEDPAKAWGILASLLKPGALMRIGLYSEIARKDIASAQSFVAEKGYPPTADGIRTCRQCIFSMPGESLITNVTRITDFYTLSETRDLLFHVHEKRFSLLQIAEIIEELGLTFLGFEFDDHSKCEKYLARYPDDPAATSLPNWHEYEQDNTDAFIGLYLFWLQLQQ